MRTIVGCGSRSPILIGWMVSRKVRKGVKNKSGSSLRLRFINPSAPFCRRHNYARHLTWIAQGGSDDSIDETFDLLPSAQWRSCHVSIGIHCVTTWNDSALGWTKQFKRYKSSWTLLQSLGIRCPARWWTAKWSSKIYIFRWMIRSKAVNHFRFLEKFDWVWNSSEDIKEKFCIKVWFKTF